MAGPPALTAYTNVDPAGIEPELDDEEDDDEEDELLDELEELLDEDELLELDVELLDDDELLELEDVLVVPPPQPVSKPNRISGSAPSLAV